MGKIKVVLGGLAALATAATLGFVVILAREVGRSDKEIVTLRAQRAGLEASLAQGNAASRVGRGRANVLNSFNTDVNLPGVPPSAFVDPMASVIGDAGWMTMCSWGCRRWSSSRGWGAGPSSNRARKSSG